VTMAVTYRTELRREPRIPIKPRHFKGLKIQA